MFGAVNFVGRTKRDEEKFSQSIVRVGFCAPPFAAPTH